VVSVRPEPKVLGYVPASTEEIRHIAGDGTGSVAVRVVNSNLVPDGHIMKLTFSSPSPDSIRARSYSLVDSTDQRTVIKIGEDLEGAGIGPVGAGLLPIVRTPQKTTVDTSRTGFEDGSPTNAGLLVSYKSGLSPDFRRPGYPDDFTVTFHDEVVDTSLAVFPFKVGQPAKFNVVIHAPEGDRRADFIFFDTDKDGTLSRTDEYVDVVTYSPYQPGVAQSTWRLQLDPNVPGDGGTRRPLGAGDVYQVRLTKPFQAADVFVFTSHGEYVDAAKAKADQGFEPYVVPNPYIGSASFEPERFAVSGRGERRIEFRGLPKKCTIRVYTVRGDLVQTLYHDGSDDGFVAWDLRSKDNLDVAPGLYVFHVDGGALGSRIGKFAIIK
jgi:hypothetical protein